MSARWKELAQAAATQRRAHAQLKRALAPEALVHRAYHLWLDAQELALKECARAEASRLAPKKKVSP